MSVIDNISKRISDIPRPVLIGGAALGVGIGVVVILRRRSGAAEADAASAEQVAALNPYQTGYSGVSPVYSGLSGGGGEYTSTVTSDYPGPQLSVGSGSLSLSDFLSAVGQYQSSITEAIMNGGGLAPGGSGAATGTQETPAPAPVINVQLPAYNPATLMGQTPETVAAVVTPAPARPQRPAGMPARYDKVNERGWYRVVIKNSPANGNRPWKYRYYGPSDNPVIAVGPASSSPD